MLRFPGIFARPTESIPSKAEILEKHTHSGNVMAGNLLAPVFSFLVVPTTVAVDLPPLYRAAAKPLRISA